MSSMAVRDFLSSHFVSVDVEDTISQLLGKLRSLDELSAVVFQGNKVLGMADKRKFLRTRLDAKKMKVKHVLTRVPHLSLEDSDQEAVRLINAGDVHTIPVIEGGKVLGVVHARDVLKTMISGFKGYRLQDISTSKLFSLNEDEPISKAINRFREKGFDHVPVVDKKGNLIGIVSTTDLLEKYFAHPPKRQGGSGLFGPASHPVKEFSFARLPIKNEMSLLVHTLTMKDSISKAVDTMVEEHVSSMVIVDGTKPVGIVTLKDLLLSVPANAAPQRGVRNAKNA